jgi:hypothetical protein
VISDTPDGRQKPSGASFLLGAQRVPGNNFPRPKRPADIAGLFCG